jgi:hypothetical protein
MRTILSLVLGLFLLAVVACDSKKSAPADMKDFDKEKKMENTKTPPLPDPKKSAE